MKYIDLTWEKRGGGHFREEKEIKIRYVPQKKEKKGG